MVGSIAAKIPFIEFCMLCETVHKSPKAKKYEKLRKYITSFREFGNDLKQKDSRSEISFHPILRLLLPQLDRERGPYGIKEHTLAKIYIRILCLPKEGNEAKKLLNFRAPKDAGNQAGDFAEVAYYILKDRCGEGKKFTVEEINAYLDSLAEKHASHLPREIDNELTKLLTGMSNIEQKWLIRIIIKDMKLGIGHTGVLNAFHLDAASLYDVSNDLNKVCTMLHDPNRRLHEIEVCLFSAFRPMLSEQCDVQKVEDIMKNNPFYYVETKHDGERFQIHINNGTCKYFSKNAFDYTDTYGCNAFEGVLTPLLLKQFKSDMRNCILDGEMMVWDKRIKAFRSKGDNIDVKKLKSGDYLRPCFCVFDVLLYNDEVLTNKPLIDRIKCLEGMFTPYEGVISHTYRRNVETKSQVIELLNEAIDEKLEGIILKDPRSVYKPNSRKAGWYKIKPEYTDGLMDQVDALIIGGYYGDGRRRAGLISHFLLGIAVPSEDGNEPKEFHSMSRVGSGYTMATLQDLLQKLEPHWQKVTPGICPPGIVWTKEKPDVWIHPKDSCVLQIKATEIVESNSFKVGYTLRFPRVVDIRYDKNWTECITLREFESLRQMASGKLYARHASNVDSDESPRKRRQFNRRAPELGVQFRSADVSDVIVKSSVFQGKEFCVATGFNEFSKQDIEKMIYENGGKFVQNPGSSTYCVLAESANNYRVRNIAQNRRYNVVYVKWLLHCLEENKIASWTAQDLISTTIDVEKEIMLKYDAYGDSYTEPATLESLLVVLKKVEEEGCVKKLSAEEMEEMDIELFSGPSPFAIFRSCVGYFDIPKERTDRMYSEMNELEVLKMDFTFYGGQLSSDISCCTTHIIRHSRCQENLSKFNILNRQREKKFHVVNEKWIIDSVEQHSRLNESNY